MSLDVDNASLGGNASNKNNFAVLLLLIGSALKR
jgi:hypothetical protein